MNKKSLPQSTRALNCRRLATALVLHRSSDGRTQSPSFTEGQYLQCPLNLGRNNLGPSLWARSRCDIHKMHPWLATLQSDGPGRGSNLWSSGAPWKGRPFMI